MSILETLRVLLSSASFLNGESENTVGFYRNAAEEGRLLNGPLNLAKNRIWTYDGYNFLYNLLSINKISVDEESVDFRKLIVEYTDLQ